MNQISIVGEKKKYTHSDIKGSVVQLGNKYYWRDSEDIVRIHTTQGLRYRRINSPLIRRLQYNGKYADISDIVKNKSGVELNKRDPDVIMVEKDWTLKSLTVTHGGKTYLKSSDNFVKTRSGSYAAKEDVVLLTNKFYKADIYEEKEHAAVLTDGTTASYRDTITAVFSDTGEEDTRMSGAVDIFNFRATVFSHWSESNSGNPNRMRESVCYCKSQKDFEAKFIPLSDDWHHVLVHVNKHPEVLKCHKAWLGSTVRDNTAKIKKRMDANYSDSGPDENNAKEINLDYGTQPGGHVFYEAGKKNIVSASTTKVGGMNYSFGVEFETSAGQLSNRNCSLISVDKIGDRSIGAFEYVSGVLHGSGGMDKVKKMCNTLSKKTFVDDKCSIHVHVGGVADKRVDTPSFGTRLSVTLINLGAKIEESLYQMSPPSRNRKLKHVAPIVRWGKITMDNYKNLLGSFLFAGDRNGRVIASDIDNDRYDYEKRKQEYARTRSKWIGGRYKWINLLNCHTARGFKTIEIRMWAGSTSYDKVSKYIMLSQAIVWYAENRRHLVFKNEKITISDVVKEAFGTRKKVREELLKFIDDRTNRFETRITKKK